ncbi:hypothetical protein K8T06_12655 [bacterium]|nr:hypothetical protein [bacterium]
MKFKKKYPINPNLTVAISGDLLAAKLALKLFTQRIGQPHQQSKLKRVSGRIPLIAALTINLLRYCFRYFRRKDLVVLLLAVTSDQGITSLFSFSSNNFRLQEINCGESVILGSITSEPIYPQFHSQISKITSMQRGSKLISTDQAGMLLADSTTRLLQHRVKCVGGLFQVAQFESGGLNIVSFDGYKFDKDKGEEYNVSLIYDEKQNRFIQRNNQTGQEVIVRLIDEHHFSRVPKKNKIFSY